MHVFRFEKDESGKEIRAPRKGNECWTMQPAYVRAKPNSQVSEWSPPIWLVHTLPEDGHLPQATTKTHLFKQKKQKGKDLVQSPAELASKLLQLKKTVDLCSKRKNWDHEDTKWWRQFWADREDMPTHQEGAQVYPADPVMLERVKQLLYGPVIVAPVQLPEILTSAEEVEATELRDLETALRPRTHAAGEEEFGRNRAVGFVEVQKGAAEVDVQRELKKAKFAATCRRTKELEDYFKQNLVVDRGSSEPAFAGDHIEVRTIIINLFVVMKKVKSDAL